MLGDANSSIWMTATKAGDIDTVLGLMAYEVVHLITGQRQLRISALRPISSDRIHRNEGQYKLAISHGQGLQ